MSLEPIPKGEQNKETSGPMPLSQTEDQLKFKWTQICFERCVPAMSDKFLNPYEKMCMEACLKNVFSVYVEIRNTFDHIQHH